MRTVLRKVGNSRGVLIPAAFLESCGIGTEIEMRLEGRSIVIEPVDIPRKDWFNGYQTAKDQDAWEGLATNTVEEEDWQW